MTHPPIFRDLTDAEQGALLLAFHRGQKIEAFLGSEWRDCKAPGFYEIAAYRIAPTPDTVDWSHIGPEWKFIARDIGNQPLLFKQDPRGNKTAWFNDGGVSFVTTPSYRNNGLPWEQSLIRRPEDV